MSEIERALATENRRLLKRVTQLEARVGAFERSRWWRLHPRLLLRRSRFAIRPSRSSAHSAAPEPLPTRASAADPEIARFEEEVVARGRFSGDWFTPGLASWEPVLRELEGREAQILEIGSFEGLSACYLLWRLPGARVTCVDSFEGILDLTAEAVDPRQLEATFDANIALVDASRVRKLVGDSRRHLLDLLAEEPRFDLVYVDGSHLGLDVLVDADFAWQLVKLGGVIVFDDYGWKDLGEDPLLRPGPAIDAFCILVEGKHEIVFRGHQVAIRRTA